MKMYFAGLYTIKNIITDEKPLYALQSFMDGETAILYSLSLVGNENFLLDSGAYTFMNSYKGEITEEVIEKYLEKYIDFINKYNIKYFFNLDLDTIIGIDKTKELRIKLEKNTGKKSIPVFHKIMGLDIYKELCKEYDYIAIGTIGDFRKSPNILKQMNRIAKKYNCKVHGLGFTPNDVEKYGFYSVDSTSWLSGGRFGQLIQFNNNRLVKYKKINCRAKDYKQINKHNFNEYIKYQKYLRRY